MYVVIFYLGLLRWLNKADPVVLKVRPPPVDRIYTCVY